jgi:hypothetical protein
VTGLQIRRSYFVATPRHYFTYAPLNIYQSYYIYTSSSSRPTFDTRQFCVACHKYSFRVSRLRKITLTRVLPHTRFTFDTPEHCSSFRRSNQSSFFGYYTIHAACFCIEPFFFLLILLGWVLSVLSVTGLVVFSNTVLCPLQIHKSPINSYGN